MTLTQACHRQESGDLWLDTAWIPVYAGLTFLYGFAQVNAIRTRDTILTVFRPGRAARGTQLEGCSHQIFPLKILDSSSQHAPDKNVTCQSLTCANIVT